MPNRANQAANHAKKAPPRRVNNQVTSTQTYRLPPQVLLGRQPFGFHATGKLILTYSDPGDPYESIVFTTLGLCCPFSTTIA